MIVKSDGTYGMWWINDNSGNAAVGDLHLGGFGDGGGADNNHYQQVRPEVSSGPSLGSVQIALRWTSVEDDVHGDLKEKGCPFEDMIGTGGRAGFWPISCNSRGQSIQGTGAYLEGSSHVGLQYNTWAQQEPHHAKDWKDTVFVPKMVTTGWHGGASWYAYHNPSNSKEFWGPEAFEPTDRRPMSNGRLISYLYSPGYEATELKDTGYTGPIEAAVTNTGDMDCEAYCGMCLRIKVSSTSQFDEILQNLGMFNFSGIGYQKRWGSEYIYNIGSGCWGFRGTGTTFPWWVNMKTFNHVTVKGYHSISSTERIYQFWTRGAILYKQDGSYQDQEGRRYIGYTCFAPCLYKTKNYSLPSGCRATWIDSMLVVVPAGGISY